MDVTLISKGLLFYCLQSGHQQYSDNNDEITAAVANQAFLCGLTENLRAKTQAFSQNLRGFLKTHCTGGFSTGFEKNPTLCTKFWLQNSNVMVILC